MPVESRYEYKDGKKKASEWTAKVYIHEGKEYRITQKQIYALVAAEREARAIGAISHLPGEVLADVLFWVEMLHNPD